MKRNKKNAYEMNSYRWFLVLDGKTTKVIGEANIADYEKLSVIIVEITASQAAAILLLNQTYKED
jgi:hypothetical protein